MLDNVPTFHQPSVLVVDDMPEIRDVLQGGLGAQGYQVWTATDGDEAINVYRVHQQEIDVILLDVNMPGRDGPSTMQAIQEFDSEARFFFMTGNPEPYQFCELLKLGAENVLLKPLDIAALALMFEITTAGIK